MFDVSQLKELADQNSEIAGLIGLIAGALVVWWFFHSIRKGT